MSDLQRVVSLLKTELSVPVYTGEIPEGQTAAAVLVQNVANPIKGRVLSGRKYGKSSVWRITVVAELQSDVESVLDLLEDMDGMSNSDFQMVFTSLVQSELGLNEEPYRRAFYDMTVYK